MFTTTWWVAQGLLVLVSTLGVIGVQQKRKPVILTFFTANTLLAAVAVALLDSYSASLVLIILTALAITSYLFDANGKTVPLWLILIFILVTVIAGAVVARHPADIIAILASAAYIVTIFQKKESSLRWFALLYLCLWVAFDIAVLAIAAIITDSMQVASTIIAIVRLNKRGLDSECAK